MPSSVVRRRAKAATKKASALASFVPNPLKDEALNTILPAFAGYAGTKFLGRMAFVQVQKRWPSLGKHTPVVASVVALVATYMLVGKIDKLKKYRDPILIGEAIALIQTIIQTYLPKFGWVVSDVSAEQYAPVPKAPKFALLGKGPAPRALPAPRASSDYDDLFDMTPISDDDLAGLEESVDERAGAAESDEFADLGEELYATTEG